MKRDKTYDLCFYIATSYEMQMFHVKHRSLREFLAAILLILSRTSFKPFRTKVLAERKVCARSPAGRPVLRVSRTGARLRFDYWSGD